MAVPDLPCIADGHNNAAGLTPLAYLSPPLFRRHLLRAVKMDWYAYIGRALTGNRVMQTYGKPHVTWTFGVMLLDERLYLLNNFSDFVTVRTYDEDTAAWTNFNATLIQPEVGALQRRQRKWLNVAYEFIDLVAV
jgi:hypothetical protein